MEEEEVLEGEEEDGKRGWAPLAEVTVLLSLSLTTTAGGGGGRLGEGGMRGEGEGERGQEWKEGRR